MLDQFQNHAWVTSFKSNWTSSIKSATLYSGFPKGHWFTLGIRLTSSISSSFHPLVFTLLFSVIAVGPLRLLNRWSEAVHWWRATLCRSVKTRRRETCRFSALDHTPLWIVILASNQCFQIHWNRSFKPFKPVCCLFFTSNRPVCGMSLVWGICRSL